MSTTSPAACNDHKLFVATHHKAMTTYFHVVLRSLSWATRIPFDRVDARDTIPVGKLALLMHGRQKLKDMGSYRGVHIMRDPRDMIVSGYHYHKWTHERWVHVPDEQGESYQQKLNRLDRKSGLLLEIEHFVRFYGETLKAWDLDDENMLEVSYETLMSDEREACYDRIFRHLGFADNELDVACDLMRLFEAGSRTGRRSAAPAKRQHLRSGKSGQWNAELEHEHLQKINRELGDVLEKFGYA